MANEIHWDTVSGWVLYSVRFQLNGNVFLTGGASDEVWGTGGRGAADYDESMIEIKSGGGASGHYVGDFDSASAIADGRYKVAIIRQIGGSPADSDLPALAKGEILWDGSSNSEIYRADEDDISPIRAKTDSLNFTGDDVQAVVSPGSTAGVPRME